jgi:hypothetical protein
MENLSEVLLSLDNLPFDLDISISAIIAGLLFSTIGYFIFRNGKKKQIRHNYWAGIVLMIYPYFVTSTLLLYIIGLGICGYVFYRWDDNA